MRLQTLTWLVGCLALLLSTGVAPAQNTFQNLDFESAAIVPVSGGRFIDFGQAFPGWTGYVAGTQQGLAVYDALAMSTAGFSIIDAAYQGQFGATGSLIEGSYTAVVVSGRAGVVQPSDATLVQTGLVPAGTESLLFKAQFDGFSPLSSFSVTLGGQTLSLVPLGSGTNYTLYGADVQALAGQAVQLQFTVFSYPQQLGADYLFLDAMEFSDQPIPEPGIFTLSALGALLLGWRVMRRRR